MEQNDSGTSLRYSLSHVISELYVQQCYTEKENSVDEEKTAEERDKHLQNSQIFNKIALKCKEAPKKNAIMQECKEQFYDEQLTENLMLIHIYLDLIMEYMILNKKSLEKENRRLYFIFNKNML